MHVAEVNGILRGFAQHLLRIDYDRLERLGRVDEIDGLRKRLKRENVYALHYGSFAGVRFGNGERLQAKFAGGECRGESAANGADTSIEREFAQEHAFVELLAEKMAHAADQA